jgi:hypothetical protein
MKHLIESVVKKDIVKFEEDLKEEIKMRVKKLLSEKIRNFKFEKYE